MPRPNNQIKAMINSIHIRVANGVKHWQVCQQVAEEFNLWDTQDCFPVWLSRIVAGIMTDQGKSTD